ncbi:MAG: radical SAM protein, partial [Thermodesulfobacteriota bacterium]
MKKPNLEELRQFVKVHKFPTDLLVETIAECNLECIMCPQKKLTRAKGEMSFELWKKIVDEVAEKSPDTRIWPALMGEPLLLGDMLFKMIKYAVDKDIYVALNTNLMVFEESMLDAFLDCGLSE